MQHGTSNHIVTVSLSWQGTASSREYEIVLLSGQDV